MIDLKYCANLFAQFGDNPGFPDTKEGLKIRIEVLQRWAKTIRHADVVVARLIETEKFCPTPAQIREACEMVPVPESQTKANSSCANCGGSGWMHEQRPDKTGRLCDFSGRCVCVSQRRAS